MSKQKINKLLIGTNNKGKLREIKSLLTKNIKIHSTSEFNLKSPIENGETFKENSLIKSKYFSKKTNMVCLADDSGLEIDVLDGAPGIYSARWAKRSGSFKKAMIYILKKIKNKKNRKARFICSLSIKLNESATTVEPPVPLPPGAKAEQNKEKNERTFDGYLNAFNLLQGSLSRRI